MPESTNNSRRALSSVIDLSGREVRRQVRSRYEHQLIGALTKRPA